MKIKRPYLIALIILVAFGALALVYALFGYSPGTNPSATDVASSTAANTTSISAGQGIGAEGNVVATSATSSTPPQVTNFLKIGTTPPPTLQDAASLVADLQTGTVFEGVNTGRRWPTASIAKLMTATLVEDDIASSTDITITSQEFAVDPADETTLVVGGTYGVNDLLHALLMPSSNVAAQAFADMYGMPQFMDAMNARARAWGMGSTYFKDSSGLSSADQSTPDDLLKLAQKIYVDYPQIFAITRTSNIVITNLSTGARVPVASINQFAGAADFVGGKTGNTPEAADNLLSVFMYHGHPFIIITMGGQSLFNDTRTLYNWFEANYH